MKAKIKIKNKVYDSVVFAIIHKAWKTKVIVFDENNTDLILVDYWTTAFFKGITRNVFLLEAQCDDWKDATKLSGYNWFIDDTSIVKRIKKKQQINSEIIKHCKKMRENLEIKTEGEIKSQTDIANLLGVAQSFHDAYVRNIIKEKDKIIIDFNTTWGCGVIFCIEGNPVTNLKKDFGSMGEILDSSMFIEDGRIFWINEHGISSLKDISDQDGYFSADKVVWSIEIY